MKEIDLKKKFKIFKKKFNKRNYKIISPFLFKFKLNKNQLNSIENSSQSQVFYLLVFLLVEKKGFFLYFF